MLFYMKMCILETEFFGGVTIIDFEFKYKCGYTLSASHVISGSEPLFFHNCCKMYFP